MKFKTITAEEVKEIALRDPMVAAEYERTKDEPLEFSVREVPLSEIRKALGFTQKDLARKVGLTQSDISQIEQGKKKMSIPRLRQIADGMGMDVKITLVPKQNATQE